TAIVFAVLSLLAAVIVLVGLRPESAAPAPRRPAAPVTAPAPAPVSVPADPAGDPPADQAAARPASASLRSLLSRSVIALTSIAFFRSLAFIGIVAWIPIYLTTQRHAGISTGLGIAVTAMYAGGIIGQPLFGLLADRFDKRIVLAADSLGSALGIFWFLTTSGHGATALLALAVFGLFTFSGFPLLMSLVADYVPKSASTTGNALVWGIGSTGGQALGPLAASLLMAGSEANLGVAFAILGGVSAVTVLATPLLRRTGRSSRMAMFG
ncbi:MAG: MFS transporter, partial [Streptosporangiaceae bacterium]